MFDSEVEKRTDEPAFKQVSESLFREMYFRLGGGEASGWTADYWRKVIEPYIELGWRFMVEEPRSAEHNRMFIVTDHKAMEHRLFFMTEQSEDHFMEWPGHE
jgi:hypothetical protein